MTRIVKTANEITLDGHAGDRVCCAMVTALSICLISNLVERLHADFLYEIREGWCRVNFEKLSESEMILIDSYFYGLQGLAKSYPENFTIIEA